MVEDKLISLATEPVGVLDIGSNSVRMVVYDGLHPAPAPIFNEKVVCGLGAGLASTGRLDDDAMSRARAAVERFALLATGLGVQNTKVVGTAALREASNGAEFITELQQSTGLKIDIISGREEARLSALGVLGGGGPPDALIGDMGGGSLELIALQGLTIGEGATLPLGPLRFKRSRKAADRRALNALVSEAFQGLSWLRAGRWRDLVLVGGAWRSLGRVHMLRVNYPLRLLHGYEVRGRDMADLCQMVENLGPESLGGVEGLAEERIETLPIAAVVLRRLIEITQPERVTISAYGLREGVIYDALSPAMRASDPLIEACKRLTPRYSRAAQSEGLGGFLFEWLSPLFADEKPAWSRLRQAVTLLSDYGWRMHPDHRAYDASTDLLHFPFAGINHSERVWMAVALRARYTQKRDAECDKIAAFLLDDTEYLAARQIGAALRFALTFCAGTVANLQTAAVSLGEGTLELRLNPTGQKLLGGVAQKRLMAVASSLGRRSKILPME